MLIFQVNPVDSNQHEIHEDLHNLLVKHTKSNYMKPFSDASLRAHHTLVEAVQKWSGQIILDACCGVGESTLEIAKNNPSCLVVGFDKSQVRLDKHAYYRQKLGADFKNLLILQADLRDLWRLISKEKESLGWDIKKQFILYPNPYPKKTQLVKRWYASPIIKDIIDCCPIIECRSNWQLYLLEFQSVLKYFNIDSTIQLISSQPITPFERKYQLSGQPCWQLLSFKQNM